MTTTTTFFESFDGTRLALHEVAPETGHGRPVILLHGLFSSAQVNWIKFGTAAQLAAAGFRCLMPDLRAWAARRRMGRRPIPPTCWRAMQALVAHLGLDHFDLVGFSLGARTAARSVIAGMAPRRLVLAGMAWKGWPGGTIAWPSSAR
jgi:pimeloyl-ACP methyl ester carboxylesterase